MTRLSIRVAFAVVLLLTAVQSFASALTPGNLVIYRVGDGVAALGSAATAVFVDEYTTAGVFVQSIAMPTVAAGSNHRLAASGTATSEGLLTFSADGQYVVFAGYDAALATASITTSTSATVPRVIGRIDLAGNVDTSTALTDAISGGNPRGATSTNGTDLWISGTSSGGAIRYATVGSTTSTSLTASPTNMRATNIFNGQLYVSSQSGAFRLAIVGAGTPTTSGQTTTNLPGYPTATTSPYQFFFADLNAGVAGVDTVYVADDGAGIQKYSLVAGSWVSNGTIASAAGLRGLAGKVSGTTVNLYSTGGSGLFTLTDTTGYNATIGGTLTSVGSPGTNKAFRGVALIPAVTSNPSGVGASSPSSVHAGESSLLTVTVTPGTNPASTGLAVSADLSSIGGSATQTFLDDGLNGDAAAGDNIFSYFATVDGATTAGAKSFTATITDAQVRTGNATIPLTIVATTTSPSGTGAANPSTVNTGDSTLLTVTVTPGTGPASTNLTVTADLSAIGGSANQSFFDDGTNGDVTPGNNVFSFLASVPSNITAGTKILPATITDAEARMGSATITLTVIAITPIHNIQGAGSTSPIVGTNITTRGIVTGVKSNGFFLQAPDAEADADPNTSEGIFVFTSSAPPAAAVVGNLVTVSGNVQEFIPSADLNSPSVTEIASPTVSLVSTGNPLPTAISILSGDTDPAGSIENLEKYEGMRVHVDTLTVVGPTQGTVNEVNATSASNGVFFGVIQGIARPFREPGIQAPTPLPKPNIPRWDNNPERIRVNSIGIGGAALEVTSGATVSNLTGPLDYGFRTYTIDADASPAPTISGNVPVTPVFLRNSNEFTIGCQNLERFFDTVDDPSTSDVALTPTAFANRLNKASLAIRNVLRTPDILGVEEMENLTTLQALASKVNTDAAGAVSYDAYLEEGNDIGGIDVGFLVNSMRVHVNSVTQVMKNDTFIDPSDGSVDLIWDRPPLVLDATIIDPGIHVTVIVNHLRSLTSVEDPGPTGVRVRAKRRAGAESLAGYVQGRQTLNPSERIVLVGDFNAFEFNDGYVDVMGTIKGMPTPDDQVLLSSGDLVNPDLIDLIDMLPAVQKYSYTFDGSAQTIDHALINSKIAPYFSRATYARFDADFPDSLRNDPNRPERISDHDGDVAYFTYLPASMHLQLTIPANVTQGALFTGTVTVLDSTDNVVTGYTGTVHFESSDPFASLPIDYTFTATDAGVHTFTNGFTLQTAGMQSVTVSDTVNAATAGIANTTVDCPAVFVTASNNGPFCEGGTLQLDVTEVSGATYSWTGPNGFTSALRNPSIVGATAANTGTYSVTVSKNGCNYNSSTDATVFPTPATPTATNGGPYVTGNTIQLFTPAVTDATYVWTGPSFTSAAQNPTIANATLANAGTYSVTITVNGCTSAAGTTDVIVTQANRPPVIDPPIGDRYVVAGSLLSFTIQATDEDNDTLSYTSTTLPSGATLDQSTGAFSWTPTTAQIGTYIITFTVSDGHGGTDTEDVTFSVAPQAPLGVQATAGATGITVAWNASAGATSYFILRRDKLADYAQVGMVNSPPNPPLFVDTTAVADNAYFYVVRAVGAGNQSPTSARDLATNVAYTDDPIAQGSTRIRADHFDQLRRAVNAVRELYGLPTVGFTDSPLAGVPIKKSHMDDLRAALQEALGVISFTDPTINAGVTTIKAAHPMELRNAMR